jgi:MFS family permease
MPAATIRSRLAGWLPAGRTSRSFLAVSLIDAIGAGMFLAGSPLFFTRTLGLSTGQVGIGMSLSGVAGMLGLVPIGRLADRWGSKRMLIALNLWRGACFAVYPFVRGPVTFFVVSFAIGLAEWSVAPVVQALIGAAEEGASRVRTMATMGSIRNAGFTVGALLATLVVALGSSRSYNALVFLDAASYFVAAAMLVRLVVPIAVRAAHGNRARFRYRLHDNRYLLLTVLNGLLYLHTVLLTVGVPLWVATRTSAPRAVVALVLVVNTAVVILGQVPLSRGSDDPYRAARRQRWSGFSLAACCLLVGLTGHTDAWITTGLVVLAVAALSLGEMWQSIGGWGISYAYAPAEQLSYYLSVYNLGTTGVIIIGPVLLTLAVIPAGLPGWLVLAAVFVATGTAVVLVTANAQVHPESLTAAGGAAAPADVEAEPLSAQQGRPD